MPPPVRVGSVRRRPRHLGSTSGESFSEYRRRRGEPKFVWVDASHEWRPPTVFMGCPRSPTTTVVALPWIGRLFARDPWVSPPSTTTGVFRGRYVPGPSSTPFLPVDLCPRTSPLPTPLPSVAKQRRDSLSGCPGSRFPPVRGSLSGLRLIVLSDRRTPFTPPAILPHRDLLSHSSTPPRLP